MNQQTVLLLGPALTNQGGMATSQKILLENWKSSKYRLKLVATHKDGNALTKIIYFLIALIKFLCILITDNPPIVYIYFSVRASFYRKSIFILLSKLFHKKVIVHARGGELDVFYNHESSHIAQAYIRSILRLANEKLVLGDNERSVFNTITRQNDSKVIPNSIDYPKQIAQKNNLPKVICTLGRLSIKKGTYDLLKAAPIIVGEIPDVEFWLCGEYEEKNDYKNILGIIKKNHLESNIKLLGYVNGTEKHNVYLKSWLYVLPSYYEGMPRSIMEAMSYGIPVISTNINGTTDLIINEESGILIEPGDIKTLAQTIILFLKNEQMRIDIGLAARQRIINKFGIETNLNKLESIFDQVLK